MNILSGEDFKFTTLRRPSTPKGSILASDGDKFIYVSTNNNNSVLTSDSSATGGVIFNSKTLNSGFSFASSNISYEFVETRYILVTPDDSVSPAPIVLPDSSCKWFSVNTTSNNGWLSDPTRFNGGSFQFTIGYVPANTSNIPSNFIGYTGSPHLTIDYTDINTLGNKFRSFSDTPIITVTRGQQVCIRRTSNLTISPGPAVTRGNINTFIIFRGM